MRILLIDDDEELMEVLAQKLIEQHYAVDIANTGEMGREFIALFNFDLVVLDWMLPDVDGVQVCKKIRDQGYTMPIMLLSARDRYTDKVAALDAGADDYVVKPFNFDELTARIRALLRRDVNASSPILHWQELSLDPKTYEVRNQNQLLPLTPKEYALMELFMRHPQRVFSPSAIIDNLWAGEDPPGEEAVRTHIKGLRQKLKTAGMPKDTIKTVYGIGYRLKSDDDLTIVKPEKPSTEISQKIAHAWTRFQDVSWQRLTILEQFTHAVINQQITNKLHNEARNCAHKLAGSLGTFGFPQGSTFAKQIESLLTSNVHDIAHLRRMEELVALLKLELQHQPSEKLIRESLDSNISLLIILDDPIYSQELVNIAQQRGMKTQIALDITTAKEIIAQESITAVLYKIVFPDGEDLIFLAQLHQQKPQVPIIVIIEDACLSDRLEIVDKGGGLILEYPVKPITAINSVTQLVKNLGARAKVLIVDDDPQILLSLELSLQPWGFQLATLDDPRKFWDVLEAVKPDILVLDIEMPEINGLELCQLLRIDRHWQQLPVLFLTVHQDENTQHQAFAHGADDYICKPVISSVLASRLLNRLQRSRFFLNNE
ncbi:multi-component transcriptional regulator [Chondrocystis sp. NIES-4102]|nr:multi-component transcriptional regulator [Chondrocystis sp. NIES-4102]